MCRDYQILYVDVFSIIPQNSLKILPYTLSWKIYCIAWGYKLVVLNKRMSCMLIWMLSWIAYMCKKFWGQRMEVYWFCLYIYSRCRYWGFPHMTIWVIVKRSGYSTYSILSETKFQQPPTSKDNNSQTVDRMRACKYPLESWESAM
jgi:hypothetical protein